MKTLLSFLLLGFFILGCKSTETSKSPFPNELAGTEACFLLYDFSNDKMLEVIDENRCRKQTAPFSTFKVPLAVMAADQGLIKHEKTFFKWDGTQYKISGWNQDQTALGWMTNSAVWVSQILTRKMGREKVQSYLNKFSYGNKDFRGDLEMAWLVNDQLKISAYEQVDFMKLLFKNQLPVKPQSMSLAKRLLTTEVSTLESLLSGKTGSGFVDEKNDKRIGWYVAHLRTKRNEYLAVLTFNETSPAKSEEYGGRIAKEALKKMLFDRGLW